MLAGRVPPQRILSALPLVMRAQALFRAVWIASSREGARAVRQDSRPSNTMQTSQLSRLSPNEETTT